MLHSVSIGDVMFTFKCKTWGRVEPVDSNRAGEILKLVAPRR